MKRLCSALLVLALLFCLPAGAYAREESVPVTRGELVQLLNGQFGVYTTGGATAADLSADSPYYYDMLAALRAGYLSGYPDGAARPDQPVSRAEAAVLMDKLSQLPQGQPPAISDLLPDWAAESAARICANGVLTLSDGAFRGNDPLTWAEAQQAMAVLEQFVPAPLWVSQVLDIPTYDGHSFQGRLCLPQGEETVDQVVIYVNGTGINTYLNDRLSDPYRFRYFDYFADRLAQQGAAFFSYNTRGVQLSDQAPFYAVDWDVYGTYTPQNIAKDVASMVDQLRAQPALKDAEIYLLGWSEGAIIAPLAVAEEGVEVDGLLLAGYPNDNMAEILEWQMDGPQTLFVYTIYFDIPGSDSITKEQFQADPLQVLDTLFNGLTFEDIDVNGDGIIDVDDFSGNLHAQLHQQLLAAVERDDTQWIRDNFMELPAGWFRAHFDLGKTEDILVQVTDVPIHIFHGTYDLNCPVQGAYDVKARFDALGLADNLSLHVFDDHNHDLNYDYWLATGVDSEGCLAIFDAVDQLGG